MIVARHYAWPGSTASPLQVACGVRQSQIAEHPAELRPPLGAG